MVWFRGLGLGLSLSLVYSGFGNVRFRVTFRISFSDTDIPPLARFLWQPKNHVR